MNAISLFSGAGGMDLGFKKAGFNIIWANDVNKDACETYKLNIGDHIVCGDIDNFKEQLLQFKDNIDLVFGGPPCQGFSVAGKMDPNDPRSKHVLTFVEIVEIVNPKSFVMENVSALGKLAKWQPIREELLHRFRKAGYSVSYIIVNASEFDVPQSRERVLFIGFKNDPKLIPDLEKMVILYKKKGPIVKKALSKLDRAGTGNNLGLCNAKITLAPKPVLRKSPFAGMLFNGMGRPIKIDGYCATLPASMGGNKTPMIDEEELYNNAPGWVQEYHKKVMDGTINLEFQVAPSRLRRLTVEECMVLQTFPINYNFYGSQSSKYRQIGNAVPCNLAFNIGRMILDNLNDINIELNKLSQSIQQKLEFI